jgi:putative ABC transport system permease protein
MALRTLDGLALRQMRTRKLRSALTSLGVVLGVGMVFGVLLLVGTIRHTFDGLIDSAWGTSDLVITAQAGGQLPQDALGRAQSTGGVDQASAMIGGIFVRLDEHGRAIRSRSGQMWVAGFDPASSPYDFHLVRGRWQRSGPEAMLESGWAAQRDLDVGDRFSVATATGRAQLRVVGLFDLAGGASFGGQGLAGIPVAEARRIMHRPSGWDQITVRAEDRGDVTSLRQALQRELGPGAQVKSPQEYGDDVGAQLDALNVVLYFFSGVALFVGGFLIFNSFNMTVLQRIRELGTLRTLGATRATIVRTVLVEALVVGLAGTLLGLLLGLGLAMRRMTRSSSVA